MKLNFIEVELSVKLKKDIEYRELAEQLTNGLNHYFLINKEMMDLHKENKFKHYSLSQLSPIEKEKIYNKGKMYELVIRFMKKDILNDFYNALLIIENPVFSVVTRSFRVVRDEEKITFLETLTPAVVTLGKKYLDVHNMDLDLVKERIILNANKKYAELNGLEFNKYDFVKEIELLNQKSVVFKYKKGIIIGNKFKIKIKEDELSQKLAFTCLGTGLLEKNSLSFGYCRARGEKD